MSLAPISAIEGHGQPDSHAESIAVAETEGEEPLQPASLRAVVESYVLNALDTSIHSSYALAQQTAQDQSGRPDILSYLTPVALFTPQDAGVGRVDEIGQNDEISLDELYRDAEEESRRFSQAMKDYEQTATKREGPLSNKGLHTWSDVLEEVDKLSGKYYNPEGLKGKIRQAFRKSGEKSDPLSAWLELLPSQSSYFSVLCGGLKLILGAASRLNDLREDIAEALIEIPTLLSCTNRVLNVFRKSKTLHECSADLFVATIALLNHILTYYNIKSARKVLSAIFKQGEFERNLSEKINSLRARAQRFDLIARTCSYESQEDTRSSIQGLRQEAIRSHQEVHRHMNITRFEAVQHTGFLAGEVKHMEDRVRSELRLVRDIICDIGAFLASNKRIDARTQNFRGPMLPLQKAKSAPDLRRRREIAEKRCLDLLRYEESVYQTDISRNLRSVYLLPKTAQDRVIAIIRHNRFQAWLAEPNSSVLFLNGNYSSTSPMRQSPTSFVCAKIVSSINTPREQAEAPSLDTYLNRITLSFFCAEHVNSKDPYQGAIGIIQSLIAQLLVGYRGFDLATIQGLQNSEMDDVDMLCESFCILVRTLPRETILFCVVDAISMYEESEKRREVVGLMLGRLIELAEVDDGRCCIFKLFITSPRISRIYQRKVGNKENVVTMPKEVQSQDGFTAAKWSTYMQKGPASLYQ